MEPRAATGTHRHRGCWTFGTSEADPGIVTFTSTEAAVSDGRLSAELQDALTTYRAGSMTPTPLAEVLGIGLNTAKSRLRLLREHGLNGEEVTA